MFTVSTVDKNKALARECEDTAAALYRRLTDVLPEEHRELFKQYSMLHIAPYTLSARTRDVFDLYLRQAKDALVTTPEKPKRRKGHIFLAE